MNSREADFVREYLATNPPNASLAYRRAYHYTGKNSDFLAVKLMRRQAVRDVIQETIEATKADGALSMAERRGFLAKVVRDKRRFDAPDAGTRINALREDAILAGERRTDGTQLTIGGDLNIALVLQSLRNGGTKTVLHEESSSASCDLPLGAVQTVSPESMDSRRDDEEERRALSAPGGLFAPVVGPLGPIRGARATMVRPAQQNAPQAKPAGSVEVWGDE